MRRFTTILFVVVSVSALASCSNNDSIVQPGPGPTAPGDDEGFFVHASSGDDNNAGTKAAPLKTIRKAIQSAALTGKDVFVAQGQYTETTQGLPLNLVSKVSLFGGYQGTTWARDPAQYVTEILSTGSDPTLRCAGADSFTIDGFTIRSPDQTFLGASSMCIYIAGISTDVVISNNTIIAGAGADGANGITLVLSSGAGSGGPGSGPGFCPTAGGSGGTSLAGFPGGGGGAGGAFDGFAGSDANGSDGVNGEGGAGGTAGSPEGKNGSSGRPGLNGTHGTAGVSLGGFTSSAYVPADGTDGTAGTAGRGGGGGGGAFGNGVSCGAGGGGGGGGGRSGGPGTGGKGGAGSFGIFISGQCTVTITNNRITAGSGGDGGDSGDGASGGFGPRGLGGTAQFFASGGNGGDGGAGGNAGHGGPGGGGPSIGIAEGPLDTTVRTGNTIILGAPGAGGTTEAAGQPNAPDGVAQDYLKFP